MPYTSNSQNQASAKKSQTKLFALVAVIVFGAGLFAGGYFVRPAVAAAQIKPVESACRPYLNLLLKGNYDKAYGDSSKAITTNMTLAQYKQLLAGLDAPAATVIDKDLHFMQVKNEAACSYHVNNLRPAEDGSVDALFSFGMSKEQGKWKVSSLSVE